MSDIESERPRFQAMILPAPTLTGLQVAELSGFDYLEAQLIWHALGMPHVEPDVVAFSQSDLDALLMLKPHVRALSFDGLISVTRVLGQSMSRIADAQSRLLRDRVVEIQGEDADPEGLYEAIRTMLDNSGPLLDHVYRRHLAAAVQQLSITGEPSHTMAAAFADLVGFTKLADDLQDADLGEVIGRFEEIVTRACVENGCRLVKVIGDAALFVSNDPAPVLASAREIVASVGVDRILPQARVGADLGPVLPFEGDYFGRTVNVASRITTMARPATIVASRSFVESLGDEGSFTRIGSRRLKGVGRVTLFRFRHPETGSGREISGSQIRA